MRDRFRRLLERFNLGGINIRKMFHVTQRRGFTPVVENESPPSEETGPDRSNSKRKKRWAKLREKKKAHKRMEWLRVHGGGDADSISGCSSSQRSAAQLSTPMSRQLVSLEQLSVTDVNIKKEVCGDGREHPNLVLGGVSDVEQAIGIDLSDHVEDVSKVTDIREEVTDTPEVHQDLSALPAVLQAVITVAPKEPNTTPDVRQEIGAAPDLRQESSAISDVRQEGSATSGVSGGASATSDVRQEVDAKSDVIVEDAGVTDVEPSIDSSWTDIPETPSFVSPNVRDNETEKILKRSYDQLLESQKILLESQKILLENQKILREDEFTDDEDPFLYPPPQSSFMDTFAEQPTTSVSENEMEETVQPFANTASESPKPDSILSDFIMCFFISLTAVFFNFSSFLGSLMSVFLHPTMCCLQTSLRLAAMWILAIGVVTLFCKVFRTVAIFVKNQFSSVPNNSGLFEKYLNGFLAIYMYNANYYFVSLIQEFMGKMKSEQDQLF